jgi:benzylsuccinate CoA-transferase BbsE subunit
MSAPQAAALGGIRVLDLTTNYSAYAGRLLADLGADVIRIEPPGGTPLRQMQPLNGAKDASYAHAFFDAGKRSVVLDLETEAGRASLSALATDADIVLDNSAGTHGWSLPVKELQEANPRLIVVSITPFGLTGPYANYVAGDLTLLAAGGLLSMGGYTDREPIGIQGEQAQIASGIFAAVAALVALCSCEKTGAGAWLDVSGQECVAFALEDAVPEWYIAKRVRRRLGDGAREAGTGIYPCMDGHVSMVAGRLGTAKAFVTLTQWIAESGIPGADKLLDPKWQDFRHRQSPEGVAKFAELFGEFCRTRGKQQLYREGQARQIAIAPVNTVADLFDDPQLRSGHYFNVQTENDGASRLVFPGPPYRLSRTPAKVRGPAPELGQHNDGGVLAGSMPSAVTLRSPSAA